MLSRAVVKCCAHSVGQGYIEPHRPQKKQIRTYASLASTDAVLERLSKFSKSGGSFEKLRANIRNSIRSDLRVLILGTNMTGLSTALTLAKNGIKPDVIEMKQKPFGFTPEHASVIPVNGTRALKEMRVLDVVSRIGHPLSQYIRCKPSGDPYGSINYKEMEGMHGVQSIGVQYSKLEKGMERLINSEGVAIRRGGKLLSVDYTTADKTVAVVTYEATPPGVNAASNSTDTKKYSKEYDIVIIAEGTVSPAREVVFKPRKLAPIYGHYQTIVPTPAGLIPGAFYDIWGPNQTAGAFPVSETAYAVYGTFGYPTTESYELKDFRPKVMSVDAFLSEFGKLEGPWKNIRNAVIRRGSCIATPVFDARAPQISSDRVLLAGEAASPYPFPYSRGQDLGASIEDGYYLGTSFSLSTMRITEAIDQYQARVTKRNKYMVPQLTRDIRFSYLPKEDNWRAKLAQLISNWAFRGAALTKQENVWVGVDARRINMLAQGPLARMADDPMTPLPADFKQLVDDMPLIHRTFIDGMLRKSQYLHRRTVD